VTQFVEADGEELQGGYEKSSSRYVPDAEYDNGVDDDLAGMFNSNPVYKYKSNVQHTGPPPGWDKNWYTSGWNMDNM
jgi:hypothetical protein